MLDLDPEKQAEAREMQLIALARYCRVGTPDYFLGWGDVTVTRVRALFGRLNHLLEMEGNSSSGEM